MSAGSTQVRKYPRVAIGSDAVIPVTIASPLNRDRGRVMVLGAGGIRADVDTPRAFSVGGSVELRFTVPGSDQPLACGGIVRDIVPGCGVGIEFSRLDSSDRDLITQAVNRWLATH